MAAPRTTVSLSPSTQHTLKEVLSTARKNLITNTGRAYAGLNTLYEYTNSIDTILQHIYRDSSGRDATPVALIALGGYGRRHQCQCSDIDLLVLFEGRIGAAEEHCLRSILHPLWDLGLSVGHQVRELSDFDSPELDNPEYLVALREARFLDGDHGLFGQFKEACLDTTSPWRLPTIDALLELTQQRHAQFNNTVFHLEPDVKDSPGGLRDATAIRLLRDMRDESAENPNVDLGRIEEAEDFMLRVRSVLHMERGRNLNILNHELQELVASSFVSPSNDKQQQVEAVMSTYFHHAQIIGRALSAELKTFQAPAHSTVVPIDEELEQAWDGIRFVDGTRASLQPQTWLRPFELALERELDLSEQVLTCIERHGDRYPPERFFPSIEERDLLLRVLKPRPGLYARLSEMHGRGLLGRLFPEFQKVYCHVIRDFYHKYTVDEHTLLTIRNVEHLLAPRSKSLGRFSALLTETKEPELLVLALLFHDVGKWTDKNHSEEGARMAVGALRRIRLPEKSIATVEFLIRHHLQMSVAAFRRDTDDPDTVTQFSRLVGTEEHLKLLCLLTLADMTGVGPDVMTPWKEEMLWRLFVATYNRLTLKYGDDVIADTGAALEDLYRQLPEDVSQQEVLTFLEGYPTRYLRVVDQLDVFEHVRLSRNLKPTELHATIRKTDASWELSAIALDQLGLFANICGVLSYFGMDILRGQAMHNDHGVVLDLFQFADHEGYLRLHTTAKTEIIDLLGDVAAGKIDIDSNLDGRQQAEQSNPQPEQIRPVLRFNNHYSRRFTVLEIVTRNAWGLLYKISRTISLHECDIELVLITTEGAQAVDVFHLTKNNNKLSPAEQDAITKTLHLTLGPTT